MDKDRQITAPRLWIALARAYNAVSHYAERTITEHGLCLSDFMVLEVLLHKGRLPISVIGEKVLLTSASMTAAIDRVEQRGFVQRLTCNSDRRIRYIELTPAGRSFISELYARHEQDLEYLAADLSTAERSNLYNGLKKFGLTAKFANMSAPLVTEIQSHNASIQVRPTPSKPRSRQSLKSPQK